MRQDKLAVGDTHSGITTYQPDNSLKKGYFSIFREILSELKRNRWLTYQLFRRDFFAVYKQSFLGIFWVFIVPLVSVGTFIMLNRSGIFSAGDTGVPYPVYALFGLSLWQIFSIGLIASSNSLVRAGSMIVKINFSKKSLVIASAGQAIISFFIQFALLLAVFSLYRVRPDIKILLIPLLIVPLILITFGLGFILALINGVMRDIENTLSLIVTFSMFLTPVLYTKPEAGLLARITKYNPLHYLISVPRDIALRGASGELTGYLVSVFIALAVFAMCIVIFHLTETRVTERI